LSTAIPFNMRNFRLLTAVMTLALAGYSADSLAAYEFVTEFGSSGTALGQFNAPRGVTVNHAGKIVITDAGNSRVELCDELGSCTGFGSFGELSGEFDKPRDVAVNSVDRIFIADRGNDRIASCASTGSCTDFGGSGTVVGKFESPRGISIDSQDQIYITDTDNNRVQICNDLGECTAFGSFGSGLGQFNSPAGIAVDSQGRVVVADRGNNRIQICSAQGTNCSVFGTPGSAVGQFNGPAGIAVDSQDRIIIVDRFNDRIQICTDQGSCTAFGSFGTGPGQFDLPWGVAVDSQDRIIVADLGNDRIQIFAEAVAPAVQVTSFTATPGTIEEGGTTTLSWTVSNATNCTALAGTSDWRVLTPDAASGTAGITIAAAGSYTFTLECTDGVSTDSADAGVTVTAPPPPSVSIDSFTATPASIREGNSTTLSWTVSHATSCSALGGTGEWQALTPNASSGTVNITISTAANYTFTLQCTDDTTTISANADVIVTATPLLADMNAGLNDAWYDPVTNGQGFFITVFPDLGLVALSWFTYDTVRPADGVTAILGEPGHRWFNAVGEYSGNQAVMDIDIASGGLFDTPTEIQHTDPPGSDGTITLTFSDCESGTVEYDIPSLGLSGVVPIERILPDNVALCEDLAGQAEAQVQKSSQLEDISRTSSISDPVTMAEIPLLATMNAGLNDAWYYPVTSGQGFFITVFPDLGLVALSWFTYDTVRPAEGVTAILGEPGHRWFNAVGGYSGNQAVMDIDIASGGLFDTPTEIQHTDPPGSDGTIILTFSDCENGTVEYDIPSLGLGGVVPIERILPDNVALCVSLAE